MFKNKYLTNFLLETSQAFNKLSVINKFLLVLVSLLPFRILFLFFVIINIIFYVSKDKTE